MREVFSPGLPAYNEIQPVALGGTGGVNQTEACSNLNLVAVADIGVKYAGLNSSGFINASHLQSLDHRTVSVKGNLKAVIGTTSIFTITDYDCNKTYTATASRGSVVVKNLKWLYYTAPATAGSDTLTINGRAINITVVAAAVNQPILTFPRVNQKDLPLSFTVISAAFDNLGGTGTHLNTDWQISTVSDFSTTAASSLADATNKTSWTPTGLSLNTLYYVRCRHRDNSSNVSGWSQAVLFRTKTNAALNKFPEAALFKTGNNLFSTKQNTKSISISEDGLRVAIGWSNHPNTNKTACGYVDVWRRDSTGWTLETSLSSPEPATNTGFGLEVVLAGSTGSVLLVAERDTASLGYGAVRYFSRSGNTWSYVSKLTGSASVSGSTYGLSIAADSTVARIAIGDPAKNTVYIYRNAAGVVTEERKITNPSAVTTCNFGDCIVMSGDGAKIAVGAPKDTNDALTTGTVTGSVWTYTRSSTTWTFKVKLTPSSIVKGSLYGSAMAMSLDGTRLAVGAPNEPQMPNYYMEAGSVAVYAYSTTWTLESSILDNEDAAAQYFGKSLALNSNGTTLFVGKPWSNANPVEPGAVLQYNRSGSVWTMGSEISPYGLNNGACFGTVIKAPSTGVRVACYAPFANNGPGAEVGSTFILV